MRLIDKDALMQALGITDMDCEKCAWVDKEWSRCKRGGDFEDACSAIENAPTIEERKTGKWINVTNDESLEEEYECSVCGYELFYSYPTKFCPNCGSRMENEKCKEM